MATKTTKIRKAGKTTKGTRTTIDTKTVEQIVKTWNTNDPAKIAETFTDDAVFQDSQLPQPISGKTAIRTYFEQQQGTFPDSRIEVRNTLVQGNQVATSGVWTGTNTGPMPTPDGKSLPPTNKRVSQEWAAFVTLDQRGKIKNFKLYSDNLAVFQQLGLPPQ